MQVGSISYNNPSFKASREERFFASLDDNNLYNIAKNKASIDVNDKKHRRIDNALFYSLPLIGGLTTLVQDYSLKPVKKGFISVNPLKVRSGKLARAGVATAVWGLALGAVSLVAKATNAIENKIKPIKDFAQEHPIISTLTSLGLALGAIYGVNKASGKLINKFVLKDMKSALKDFDKVTKFDNVLNNSKILNGTKKVLEKVPSSIKDIAKTAISWSPLAVILTQLTHGMNHGSVKATQTNKNFVQLKQAQNNIRQELVNEELEKELEDRV